MRAHIKEQRKKHHWRRTWTIRNVWWERKREVYVLKSFLTFKTKRKRQKRYSKFL